MCKQRLDGGDETSENKSMEKNPEMFFCVWLCVRTWCVQLTDNECTLTYVKLPVEKKVESPVGRQK